MGETGRCPPREAPSRAPGAGLSREKRLGPGSPSPRRGGGRAEPCPGRAEPCRAVPRRRPGSPGTAGECRAPCGPLSPPPVPPGGSAGLGRPRAGPKRWDRACGDSPGGHGPGVGGGPVTGRGHGAGAPRVASEPRCALWRPRALPAGRCGGVWGARRGFGALPLAGVPGQPWGSPGIPGGQHRARGEQAGWSGAGRSRRCPPAKGRARWVPWGFPPQALGAGLAASLCSRLG